MLSILVRVRAARNRLYTMGMTNVQRKLVFNLYLFTTVLSILALFVLIIGESYVRWKINFEFSFLSGSGLTGLAILVLGELLGLAYLLRGER